MTKNERRIEDLLKRGKKLDQRGRKIEQLIADHQKPMELVREHLTPCGEDLLLIALKGHLIIENLLEMNLCRLLSIDSLPEKEKLEFSQKLELVQAVVLPREPGPNADLFCAIRKLNKTRNDMAHKLMNPGDLESAVTSIIQSYQSKADLKLNSATPLAEQLRNCIIKLCLFLDEINVQSYKLKLQDEND